MDILEAITERRAAVPFKMSKRLSQDPGVNSGGDALLGILAPMLSSSGSDSVADGVVGPVGRLFAGR